MAHAAPVGFDRKFRTAAEQVSDLTGYVCWSSLRGQPCDCGGLRRHFPEGTCGSHLNAVLKGRRRGCGFGDRCNKVHLQREAVMSAIEPFLEKKRCTVPPNVILERIKKHADKSPYLQRFISSPFLDDFLNDNDLRLLLASSKNRAKEICEAYAASDRVLEILRGIPEDRKPITIFDVCSGKGFLAALLSFILPSCNIVMLDADGAMKVPHVDSRPNLSFRQIDIFSTECARLVQKETGEGGACILVGVHLCGNLSPRLIDIGSSVDCCEGFVLCPCCLKGKLGSDCNNAGKALGHGGNYKVLIDTMKAEAERRGGGGTKVKVGFDTDMMSPKNGFISCNSTTCLPCSSKVVL
ncbi:hypothetical protein TrRE_jg3540 [Triparma retinervis]|uniref:Methyltransferase domain-containing protein n=1 Tax=Triparma retinervis TaxID=2557542 RepID=A0A9W6ZSU6_9STRA|nr:hypothetical protein TrRE_jg3540 [Triparma retinervis]